MALEEEMVGLVGEHWRCLPDLGESRRRFEGATEEGTTGVRMLRHRVEMG